MGRGGNRGPHGMAEFTVSLRSFPGFLRHALMTLLIACLAFPAVAMPVAPAHAGRADAAVRSCHDAPAPSQTGPDQGATIPAAMHGCIGCIAPVFRLAELSPPALAGTGERPVVPSQALAGRHLDPDPPPPRF